MELIASALPDPKALLDVLKLLLSIIRRQQVDSAQATQLCKLMVPGQEDPPLLAGIITPLGYLAALHICTH